MLACKQISDVTTGPENIQLLDQMVDKPGRSGRGMDRMDVGFDDGNWMKMFRGHIQ